jgi:hypothetical protein
MLVVSMQITALNREPGAAATVQAQAPHSAIPILGNIA